jgi:nitrogen-specific signal transduction histidine kinase
VSFGDLLAENSPARRSNPAPQRSAAVTMARQKNGERTLPTLMMPIGMLLEFLPCAAALWSADRAECVFNTATKSLLGYCENDFCADQKRWLERIDPADRETFLRACMALQQGERKTSCHYRFTPQNHAHSIVLQETAVVLPTGPAGKAAIFSVYQTKPEPERELRGDRPAQEPARGLIHQLGNSLQAIRGEVDLLRLIGELPDQSFENITRGIERLHDLIGEIEHLPGREPVTFASGRCGSVVAESSRKSLE